MLQLFEFIIDINIFKKIYSYFLQFYIIIIMFRLIELKLAKAKGSRKIRKIVKFLRKIFGEKDPGNIGLISQIRHQDWK